MANVIEGNHLPCDNVIGQQLEYIAINGIAIILGIQDEEIAINYLKISIGLYKKKVLAISGMTLTFKMETWIN